jgi:hypothetical protein
MYSYPAVELFDPLLFPWYSQIPELRQSIDDQSGQRLFDFTPYPTLMRLYVFVLIYHLLWGALVHGQSLDPKRNQVIAESEKYIGIKEVTGRNDHPEIKGFWKWINPAYYNTRPPYCAAYVYASFRQAGYKPAVKTPALAASWYRPDLVVWSYNPHGNARRVKEPPAGSLALYRFRQANGSYRIGHIGILARERRRGENFFIVNEGNTSGAGAVVLTEADREGNGIYKKRRSEQSVYLFVDWFPTLTE